MVPGIDSVMLNNAYHKLFPPLTPEQYHSISCQNFKQNFSPYVDGSVPPIHLASIFWSSKGLKAFHVGDANNPVIIPINPVITYERWAWTIRRKTMANGWERNDFAHESTSLEVNFEHPESWLSQANGIFDRLNVTSMKEHYALVNAAIFTLYVGTFYSVPHGYLFVCPPEAFRLPGTSSFRWPDCPAYWSFDPTGAERLSTEAAMHLGFPLIKFRTRVHLLSWNDGVYAGLREFHNNQAFDPDDRDIARHLGYLTYKVSDDKSPTGDEEDSCGSPIHVQSLPSVDLTGCYGLEDFVPLSRTSKFLMAIQLALMIFIAVSSAYNGGRAQLN
ncbi:hypothetical protein B0H11DRAFT_1310911 [Mycena galericulata]|nr:hypothetical protein B0H11DRAFT_1310911 [Mycena galericulata]